MESLGTTTSETVKLLPTQTHTHRNRNGTQDSELCAINSTKNEPKTPSGRTHRYGTQFNSVRRVLGASLKKKGRSVVWFCRLRWGKIYCNNPQAMSEIRGAGKKQSSGCKNWEIVLVFRIEWVPVWEHRSIREGINLVTTRLRCTYFQSEGIERRAVRAVT